MAGSNKGNTQQGDVFNDPFRLGKVDPQYTSSRVTKDYNLAESTKAFTMDWKPVIPGTISVVAGATTYVDDGKGMLIAVEAGSSVARRTVMVQPVDDATAMGDLRLEGVQPTVEASAGTVDYAAGTITFTTGLEGAVQVAYSYKNIIVA